MKRLICFDLDGTLTQHRTPLDAQNRAVLDKLGKKHKLLMVGAGGTERIWNQMGQYPIDILGNYGMQESKMIDGKFVLVREDTAPVDQAFFREQVAYLREKYGYTEYKGESVEFHASGMVTFPMLGTKADIADKLAYDPDRSRRKVMYPFVCELFHDYRVVIGGSSSFDIAPHPYNKLYALDRYCAEHGMTHADVLYCGDDYGVGGNDEQVYLSDIDFVKVDDYRKLGEYLSPLLD